MTHRRSQDDFNNKLVSVDQTVGTYKYDALGRRIAKNNTLFYFVGDQMVEDMTDGVTTSYLYGNNIDEALQMKREDDVYYYHTNHLGSVMTLSNSQGVIKERIEYDVYGTPTFISNQGDVTNHSQIGNTILFTGHEFDLESKLYNLRVRAFSPFLGRFIQKDPIMYIDGMNDLAYVNNAVVTYIDVFGYERNPVVDFLFGGCLDLPKNWKCAENGWQKAGAVALCGLDVAGFIPGAGPAAKGAKGAAMAGKAAKAAKGTANAANKADNVINAANRFGKNGTRMSNPNKVTPVKPVQPTKNPPQRNPNPKQPEKQPQPKPRPQPQPNPNPAPNWEPGKVTPLPGKREWKAAA